MRKTAPDISNPDHLLLDELKRGSSKAFDLVFRKYYDNLCRFTFSVIHDADMSQSLVQNVFIKLWDRRFALGQINNLAGYLTAMVKNQISDHLKDQRSFDLSLRNNKKDIADHSTEYDIFSKDFEECLILSLSRLPSRCRQAFEFSRFESLSNKEIAQRMGITVKGVEALIGRSLKVLRVELREFLPSFDPDSSSPILFFLRISKNIFPHP